MHGRSLTLTHAQLLTLQHRVLATCHLLNGLAHSFRGLQRVVVLALALLQQLAATLHDAVNLAHAALADEVLHPLEHQQLVARQFPVAVVHHDEVVEHIAGCVVATVRTVGIEDVNEVLRVVPEHLVLFLLHVLRRQLAGYFLCGLVTGFWGY